MWTTGIACSALPAERAALLMEIYRACSLPLSAHKRLPRTCFCFFQVLNLSLPPSIRATRESYTPCHDSLQLQISVGAFICQCTAFFNPQHGRSDLDNSHWSLSLILWVDGKSSSTAMEELRKNHTTMQKTDTWVKAWLTLSWLLFCCFPLAKAHRAEGKRRGNLLWTAASSWRCPVSRLMLLSCWYHKPSQNQRERIFFASVTSHETALSWSRPNFTSQRVSWASA